MNKVKCFFAGSLTILLLFSASIGYAQTGASIRVDVGFLEANPQIFPVGELISIEAIENDEDIDLGDLPDIFYVEVSADDADLDMMVKVHIQLDAHGTILANYWSEAFQLRRWMDSNYGRNGYFTNTALWNVVDYENFLNEDPRTEYVEAKDVLYLLDGRNLSAGLYTVRLELYDEDERLITSRVDVTQVYNPPSPTLEAPREGEEVVGYPILFSWNWSGGSTSPADWTLIIVEGDDNEDPETVIQSRNMSNIRFEGTPQANSQHNYTGLTGDEQMLQAGKTYYWMVKSNIPSVVPGDPKGYESNVQSFVFVEVEETSASGGSGVGEKSHDPLLDRLALVLPQEIIEGLTNELEGFDMEEIIIDGVGGYTRDDLIRHLSSQDITILTVGVE